MNRGLGAKGGLKEDAISLSKAFNCSPGCFIFVAEAARRGNTPWRAHEEHAGLSADSYCPL